MVKFYAVFHLFFGGRYWVRYIVAALLFGLALWVLSTSRAFEAERRAYLAAPVPEAEAIDGVRYDRKAQVQLVHLRATLDPERAFQFGMGGRAELVYMLQEVDARPDSPKLRAYISIPLASREEVAAWVADRVKGVTDAGFIIELDGEVRALKDDKKAAKGVGQMKWEIDPQAFRFAPYLEPRHERLARMEEDPVAAAWVVIYGGAAFAALGALQGLLPRRQKAAAPVVARKPRLSLSRRAQGIIALLSTVLILGFVAQDLFAGKSVWTVALGLHGPAAAAMTYAKRTATAAQASLAPVARAIAAQEARTMARPEPRPTSGPIATAPSLLERLSPFLAHARTATWMPLVLVLGIGLAASLILGPAKPLAKMAEGTGARDLPFSMGSLTALAVTLAAAGAVQGYLRLQARARIITSDTWERIERERIK